MAGRVLIVDDDPALCATLESAFQRAGFSVALALNGKQCLDSVAQDPPDVVVLDVVMPVMDGFQVLHHLRESPTSRLLPVVMLTGREEDGTELEGWMAGADRYLSKPCEVSTVVSAVRELLREEQSE
ncbi:MAG: response regulator [Armatimonadetes bacterium]|nr:response regulator [Armatimonadota bacterium]